MKNKNSFLNLIQHSFNRLFYSVFFPIILLIFLYFINKFWTVSVKLLIIINFIMIFYWLFKLIYIPKNKTQKYGIVFLINNGELYNESIYLMFKKLQFELQDNFKILVFNSNFIRKFNDLDKNNKVFFKKKYHMIINMFSLNAKINAENISSLKNKNITFLTPVPELDEKIKENLRKDFSYGFKKILELSEKNSYIDINKNANILSLSIRHFVSIIYLIFNQVDLAEKQLKLMDFSGVDNNDKTVQYLKKSRNNRYAEIYHYRINRRLNKCSYLYDATELNELCELVQKFKILIESDSSLIDYRCFMNDTKSKICFAEGNYSESLASLMRLYKKNPNDYSVILSKAFVEINQGNIKGFETYKKISKKKDINKKIIMEECIPFIDNALKNSNHDKGLLLLCKGILTYYWIDSIKGLEMINDSLSKIKNQDILNYAKVRFKKIK